jgi:CRISPR-associated endonuclease/helicase Cas3
LDIAAVGQVLLQRHTALRQLLAERLGLPEDTLIAWHTFFLALHDIGKFSKRFQGLIQHWPNYTIRHDSLGWLLWRENLADYLLEANLLNLDTNIWEKEDWLDGLNYWARAVTGHHG